jgi:hypothetical protein
MNRPHSRSQYTKLQPLVLGALLLYCVGLLKLLVRCFKIDELTFISNPMFLFQMADEKLSPLDPMVAFCNRASLPRCVLFLHMPLQLRFAAEGLVASLDLTLYFASAGTRVRCSFRMM